MKSKLYDACIFDLDGVIVHTAHLHYEAWKKLAASLKIDFSEEQNEELKGVDRITSLEKILSWSGMDLPQDQKLKLCVQKNDMYVNLIQDINRDNALPGVIDLLSDLKKQGTKLAIGSASKNAVQILRQLDILSWFDDIIDGTKVTRSKPDPQTFLLACESLQSSPSQSIVFEDSVAGVLASKTGGFITIGVGDEETLKNADLIIPSFENFDLKTMDSLVQSITTCI